MGRCGERGERGAVCVHGAVHGHLRTTGANARIGGGGGRLCVARAGAATGRMHASATGRMHAGATGRMHLGCMRLGRMHLGRVHLRLECMHARDGTSAASLHSPLVHSSLHSSRGEPRPGLALAVRATRCVRIRAAEQCMHAAGAAEQCMHAAGTAE